MDNATYLGTALAMLRDHPPGFRYQAVAASDARIAALFGQAEWSEEPLLPMVLGREYQEALGAYLARIGAWHCLPHTLLSASPYGDVDEVGHRRLLIDAADLAITALD